MLVSLMVDGKLCDGGIWPAPDKDPKWWAGWSYLPKGLGSVAGGETLGIDTGTEGLVVEASLYSRALFNSELIGNFRHGVGNSVGN